MLATHRYREKGSTGRGTTTNTVTTCEGVVTTSSANLHRTGEVSGMFDTVIPGFHKRRAAGEVFVNTMTKITQTFGGGGTGPKSEYLRCDIGGPTALKSGDYQSSQRNWNLAYQFNESRDSEGRLVSPIVNLVDIERIKRAAYTSAMANVENPTAQGLVTLLELRQTLQMLRSPFGSMQRLTEAFRKSKTLKRAIVRASTEGPRAVADQYLVYYYGLKPFLHDIHNILEAYLIEGQHLERKTARGVFHDSKTESVQSGGPPAGQSTSSWFLHEFTTSQDVEVRAGILYQPTLESYRKVLGFRLGDVIPALYEATPWSFFVDYFSNLGKFLEATAPRVGIEYLAQWLTVRTVTYEQALTLASGITAGNFTHSRQGTEYAFRRTETVARSPTGRYEYIGLALKFDPETWQLAKSLAVTSLFIQTAHRLLGDKISHALHGWAYKKT